MSFYIFVVAFKISNLCLSKILISSGHLCNSPVKSCSSFLRICDNRYEKMRNTIVHRQLYNLRIDHDKSYIFRLSLIDYRQYHRIDTYRLT